MLQGYFWCISSNYLFYFLARIVTKNIGWEVNRPFMKIIVQQFLGGLGPLLLLPTAMVQYKIQHTILYTIQHTYTVHSTQYSRVHNTAQLMNKVHNTIQYSTSRESGKPVIRLENILPFYTPSKFKKLLTIRYRKYSHYCSLLGVKQYTCL